MTTQRNGLALGWKIFWGTLASVVVLLLVGTIYIVWALGNTTWG